jgi:hypothetical protein
MQGRGNLVARPHRTHQSVPKRFHGGEQEPPYSASPAIFCAIAERFESWFAWQLSVPPPYVASKGGNPRHPAWFHNLRSNPAATIQVGSERRAIQARVATPEEAALAESYPGVQRLRRLSGPHRAGDPARHPGTAVDN